MKIESLLKDIRQKKMMTLSQLANKSGVSKSHISDIENNLKEPGLSVLIRLAKALDVNVTELYKVNW